MRPWTSTGRPRRRHGRDRRQLLGPLDRQGAAPVGSYVHHARGRRRAAVGERTAPRRQLDRPGGHDAHERGGRARRRIALDVGMEAYEHTGLAAARARWTYPGQAQAVIPASRLYPAAPPANGLTGHASTTPAPACISARSSSHAPIRRSTSVGDGFAGERRHGGQLLGAVDGKGRSARHRHLSLLDRVGGWRAPDGQRRARGEQLADHAATTNTSAAISLTAGVRYTIKLEYYDHTGSATARLQWSFTGQATQVIPTARLFQQ